MITLFKLMERVSEKNLTVTTREALEIPQFLNQKKGQVCLYDWDAKTIWLSMWDLEFDIVDGEVKNE